MSHPPVPYKFASSEQGHSQPIDEQQQLRNEAEQKYIQIADIYTAEVEELQQLRNEVKLLTAELLRMRAIQQLAAHLDCSLALAERILNIETRIGKMQ
jgi:hypothetical protein